MPSWISSRRRAYPLFMYRVFACAVLFGLSEVACGGSCKCADAPSSATEAPPESAAENAPATSAAEAPTEAAEARSSGAASSSESASEAPTSDVQFPENASVAQAVAAVPRGTPRANIDAETLAEPLQSESLWAPCKVGAQHFKVKVAVWNGHAVGVDVTSTSKPLAACVEKQVRGVEWRDKVKSLNSVEYSM
jgi:hypothetical protein